MCENNVLAAIIQFFLQDLSSLSPQLLQAQRDGDCLKATNLSITWNKGCFMTNLPHVNRDNRSGKQVLKSKQQGKYNFS